MVKVNWTLQSISDITNIADFIAKDSERYAQIQVGRFFEATENNILSIIIPESIFCTIWKRLSLFVNHGRIRY